MFKLKSLFQTFNILTLGFILCTCNDIYAQNDSSYIRLDTITLKQKAIRFKESKLYDIQEEKDNENIRGFYALSIFENTLDKQIWVSPETQCIQMKMLQNDLPSEKSILTKWDKITGGCKWLGMGFGWDNWKPKDMSLVTNDCAIEIKFKSPNTDLTNLPLAFALEDYSGSQAFKGFTTSQLSNKNILKNEWNFVRIPLSDFPFDKTETDPSNIKQFIIQFEADGELIIDHIKLIQLPNSK